MNEPIQDFPSSINLNGVVLSTKSAKTEGTLRLCPHSLQFVSSTHQLEIAYMNVDSVEKKKNTASFSLHMKTKNFLFYIFVMPSERECDAFSAPLRRLIFPTDSRKLPPFFYQPSFLPAPPNASSHLVFPFSQDLERMKVPLNPGWRQSLANQNFAISRFLPQILVVPSLVQDEIVKISCKFRQGRVPSLSYLHPNS
eukprot:Sdes_comp24066_c0_seq1m22130